METVLVCKMSVFIQNVSFSESDMESNFAFTSDAF